MLATSSKSKLPKTLSYPLGAQAISEVLEAPLSLHAPKISFRGSPIWPASMFQKRLKDNLPYVIMSVRYRPPSRLGISGMESLRESGWYDSRFWIEVFPVKRELRSIAGRLLLSHGIQAIVNWIEQSNSAGWETRDHSIDIVFDPIHATACTKHSDGI